MGLSPDSFCVRVPDGPAEVGPQLMFATLVLLWSTVVTSVVFVGSFCDGPAKVVTSLGFRRVHVGNDLALRDQGSFVNHGSWFVVVSLGSFLPSGSSQRISSLSSSVTGSPPAAVVPPLCPRCRFLSVLLS